MRRAKLTAAVLKAQVLSSPACLNPSPPQARELTPTLEGQHPLRRHGPSCGRMSNYAEIPQTKPKVGSHDKQVGQHGREVSRQGIKSCRSVFTFEGGLFELEKKDQNFTRHLW